MSQLLTDYFRHELVALGYPDDLEIAYSLSYCQGDGMAFYGKLEFDHIKAITYRILTKQQEQNALSRVQVLMLKKSLDRMFEVMVELPNLISAEIRRNSFGNHYSHWNTMTLEAAVEDYFFDLEDLDEMQEQGIDVTAADVQEFKDLWEKVVEMVEEDIVATSKRLESEGYSALDAVCSEDEVIWEFETKQYLVRISEVASYHFGESFYHLDYTDMEDAVDTVKSYIKGDVALTALKAEVMWRDTEEVLGDAMLSGIEFDVNDKTYAGYKRELLLEAVHATRTNMGLYKKEAA